MTTSGTERGTKLSARKNGHVTSHNSRKGDSSDADLPDFMTEILVQYKDLLVQHVETVKNKAVSEVKEEALLLHSQAEMRLRSMESEVQQGVQAVLVRAREAIFEMVRTEMGDIFSDLEARLQALLDTGESSDSPAKGTEDQGDETDESDSAIQSLLDGAESSGALEDGTEEARDSEGRGEKQEQAASHADVRLELPPPLDPRHLLGFYRGLSSAKEVRILRALGSLDKGVDLYIRPREPSSVPELLRTLPGVQEVSESSSDGGGGHGSDNEPDGHRTLRILLTAAGR